jgi:hypothetical protein
MGAALPTGMGSDMDHSTIPTQWVVDKKVPALMTGENHCTINQASVNSGGRILLLSEGDHLEKVA